MNTKLCISRCFYFLKPSFFFILPNKLYFIIILRLIFRRINCINASVIHSEDAKHFLRKVNDENPPRKEKISNNFQQKSFHEVVVEKVLSQRNMNRNNKKIKSKRKFRKISKSILLLKMFSKENKSDDEEDSLCEESVSLSYYSCRTSQTLYFYSSRSPRDSSLTSSQVQTNPDILIDQVEDTEDQIAKLHVDLGSILNPPLEKNLLSASYQDKNIIHHQEENRDDNKDLFSTKYKTDFEECSINVSFYHQVIRIRLSPLKVFKPIRNFLDIKEFSVSRLMGKLYIFYLISFLGIIPFELYL